MRLHIHHGELEPEQINLILLIALFLAAGAAIFYLGTSFSAQTQTAGFVGPVSPW